VLGVVACCGALLSATGAPSAPDHNASDRGPIKAGPVTNSPAPLLRDIPRLDSSAAGNASTRPTRSNASRPTTTPGFTPSRVPTHLFPTPHNATPAASIPVGGQPGLGNTGVPAGVALRSHVGNLVITQAGATYDALDIHGFVIIQAPNVTITRSIIRGGVAKAGTSTGLVNDTDSSGTHFVLKDSELVPEYPSVAIDGIQGSNYTLSGVDIHGTVDGAKVFGNNVTIERSWLHGTVSYAHDPYQNNGPTHNDAIQVLGGQNILITGNTIDGGSNSALQITQDHSAVSGLTFTNNWVDGGACSANIADKPMSSMSGINISNNTFGHTSLYKNCAIIVSSGVSMQDSGNTWADTNQPVAVTPRS
jgi:hypothetical protein